MSRFLNGRYATTVPYVPGEQPKGRDFVKLNANESPYPPSPKVLEALDKPLVDGMRRYADPRCLPLRQAFANRAGVPVEWVFAANGSDEALAFVFLTFFHTDTPLVFPDVTYSFYHDYCGAFNVPFREVPLRDDLTIDVDSLIAQHAHVVLPNPNAPTGYVLPVAEIERLCDALPDRLVVIDEAYVDFGNESCVPAVSRHDNLVVVQTFSKSRNLAGAHVGFAIAQQAIIDDIRDVKFCFDPFNVSAATQAIGMASLADEPYFRSCTQRIVETRDRTIARLRAMGFTVTGSHANFLFATRDDVDPQEWNAYLRQEGILARYFSAPRTCRWLRVSIGADEDMDRFVAATERFLRTPE